MSLFNDAPRANLAQQPYLASVQSNSASVGVSQAYYDESTHTLHLALQQVADPAILRNGEPVRASLVISNAGSDTKVELNAGGDTDYSRLPNGDLTFDITVAPDTASLLMVRQGH